ncbi:TetR family transcriptional regulator [Streptomyces sp. NPDC051662]|uniref:acyl-CoA-like ligand-binding transcription factor n=1 Tax=Streptomyces sp. NPDC051662 TaxID=3154750 RepID=UPI00342F9328
MTPKPRSRTGRPEGLRERRRRETHRLLASTTLRLVVERGLDGVTVEDISGTVGVSSRTFFNYFATKEDALVLPYPDAAEFSVLAAEAVVAAPDGLAPLDAVAHAWRPGMERIDADRDEWLARVSVLAEHPSLVSRMTAMEAGDERRMIEAIALRTGLAADDSYPALLYHIAGGALRACLRRWQQLGGARSLVGLMDHAVRVVAVGLPAPPVRVCRGTHAEGESAYAKEG